MKTSSKYFIGGIVAIALVLGAIFLSSGLRQGSSSDAQTMVIHLKRSDLDRFKDGMVEILSSLRMVPALGDGGAIIGMKIMDFEQEGIAEIFGVKTGDVILKVNDIKLDSPSSAMEMYQTLRAKHSNYADVLRDGKPLRLEYVIDN